MFRVIGDPRLTERSAATTFAGQADFAVGPGCCRDCRNYKRPPATAKNAFPAGWCELFRALMGLPVKKTPRFPASSLCCKHFVTRALADPAHEQDETRTK